MFLTLLAALPANHLWFFPPLVVAISLVYGATRHEFMRPIMQHSLRAAVWILTFMGTIFAALLLVAWSL